MSDISAISAEIHTATLADVLHLLPIPMIDIVACRWTDKATFAASGASITRALKEMHRTIVDTFDNDVMVDGLMLTGGTLLALITGDAARGDFDFVGKWSGSMSPTRGVAISRALIISNGRIVEYTRAPNYDDPALIHVDILDAVIPRTYLDSFDFSFCANLLWVQNYDDCTQIRIKMWDPVAIMTRSFTMTGRGLVNLVKVNAYSDQLVNFENTLEHRLERFRVRAAKYSSRGYTIVEDFTYDDCVQCWFDEYDRQHLELAAKYG